MGATLESLESVRRSTVMRRLVIVAENSLLVEAIRIGFQRSGEFKLVGHADARRTSAPTILGAEPDVVLLDDMDRSETALALLRAIVNQRDSAAVIVLSTTMDAAWLEQVFDAGATAVISKATQPVALATLVRETLNGHVVHQPAAAGLIAEAHRRSGVEDLPLTDRELEILQLVASGSTNGDIARRLWVTEQTVKFHLRNVYRKLDVANRTQASHFAHMRGLVTPQPAPARGGDLALAAASA